MNGKTLNPRLKASGIQLSLSALAFFIVLYFIVFLWYPNPHFSTNGGWQGVRIMLFVDIVLGPPPDINHIQSGKINQSDLVRFNSYRHHPNQRIYLGIISCK